MTEWLCSLIAQAVSKSQLIGFGTKTTPARLTETKPYSPIYHLSQSGCRLTRHCMNFGRFGKTIFKNSTVIGEHCDH
jgi:hypothetical protein